MKAAEPKAAATPAKNNSPFFSKESGQDFFGNNHKEQPFFSKSKNSNSLIQPKLTIGQPNDVYEKEADATADKVVQRLSENKFQAKPERNNFFSSNKTDSAIQQKPVAPISNIDPPVQTKCATCEQEEKLQKKEERDKEDLLTDKLQKKPIFESNAEPPDDEKNIQRKCAECEKEDKLQKKSDSTPQTASPNIESSLSSSKGSGSPLPNNTREQMESSFGTDFSGVRIHNDSSSVQMNKDLHAQAFTHGSDIYFNSGKLDTNSNSGKHLMAHELTHVVQQGKNRMSLQRDCDPTVSSCIPESYNNCNPNISSCPQPLSSQNSQNPFELIPSNSPGSFSLIPIANPPSQLLADVQEGMIVDYQATPVPTTLQGNLPGLQAKEFIGPGSATLLSAVNQSLMNTGFATVANGNGIGIIAIPRLGTAGAAVPESLSLWGHTAAYVRINGQITIVRGFTVDSMFDAAANLRSVPAGNTSIPGAIANDQGLFTITNARTVEWPVTADAAKAMADSLPQPGAPPAGGPSQYTGRPGVSPNTSGASNCVGFACNAAEGQLGGKIGTPKLGNVAEPANAAEGLQGRMMQLTKTGSSDISPSGAIVSGMPLKFQILKWGGRFFLVLGAVITIKQVIEARGEHRREIEGQAFGSFAGGVTLGAFAAGFCVGAGIATGGIALLVCAGVAGIAGAVGGHYAGGAVGRQFD